VQYQLVANNPFAVLTAIVAPAILTNVCSVLALGTSNRLGRVVDRTRIVTTDIIHCSKDSQEYAEWTAQLQALQRRVHMLLPALRLIYAALGLFASTALISVAGSVAAYFGLRLLFRVGVLLAFVAGASAVIGLTVACYFMVHETRLAVRSLGDEARVRLELRAAGKTPCS
jgi:hypothetical protein